MTASGDSDQRRAQAHDQASAAHSQAADMHRAAAVMPSSSSADHQAAIAAHNMAASSHQTAANAARSGASAAGTSATGTSGAADTSLAGRDASQSSLAAEGHSLKAVQSGGQTPETMAAHAASTAATQATMNANGANPAVAPRPAVSNQSKRNQMAKTASRMASPMSGHPTTAAQQFVGAAKRSGPLRRLWQSAAESNPSLPLHQQMNQMTGMLKTHGFATSAHNVIGQLGDTHALSSEPQPNASSFVNRLLGNPQMLDAFNGLVSGIGGAPAGMFAQAIEQFLRGRGYTGTQDDFQHAFTDAMISKGRRWTGQYEHTSLIPDTGNRRNGPSLTVEPAGTSIQLRLNGNVIQDATVTPRSEFATLVSWPAQSGGRSNLAAGAITFSEGSVATKAADPDTRSVAMFAGTLTFNGQNPYGLSGTVRFQGMRSGPVHPPAPASPAPKMTPAAPSTGASMSEPAPTPSTDRGSSTPKAPASASSPGSTAPSPSSQGLSTPQTGASAANRPASP
jgi:hypothetical protein